MSFLPALSSGPVLPQEHQFQAATLARVRNERLLGRFLGCLETAESRYCERRISASGSFPFRAKTERIQSDGRASCPILEDSERWITQVTRLLEWGSAMGHYISFVIRSWQEDDDGAMHWSVHLVDDPSPLHFPDGCFLVRTWIDDSQIVRGLIRHLQSGCEMQFQSGQSALGFIRSWMGDLTPGEPVPGEEAEVLEGLLHSMPGRDGGEAHG
jgi:hypothetical protein